LSGTIAALLAALLDVAAFVRPSGVGSNTKVGGGGNSEHESASLAYNGGLRALGGAPSGVHG